MKNLFQKKISIIPLFIVVALAGIGGYWISNDLNSNNNKTANEIDETELSIVRDSSYKFTKPVRYFESKESSEELSPIKTELTALIANNTQNGNLFNASVYLRDMQTGEWTTVNENINYHPGSLIKVPMLIYYLKESEKNASILDKKLSLSENFEGIPVQSFNNQQIEKGKEYSVRELLKYMVSYSDNNATFLLNNNCDIPGFKKVYADLKLPVPEVNDSNYAITIRDYSVFLRVLYNSTYLNPTNSDFALKLLSESSFKQGMAKNIPSDITVARKFGETKKENKRELHESGIIYCNNRPYLLTIMTKGYNPTNLASFISNASDSIFHYFCI